MRLSFFPPALVAALVGYGSTIALVLSAAAALGAGPQDASGMVLAIGLALGLGSAALSAFTRVPLVLAWSTPGAALIAATDHVTLPEAAGAFVVCGLAIAATGLVRPLGSLVARIPDALSAAMLGGVLLPFCLRGGQAAASLPGVVLPMVLAFVVVRLFNPAMAVLAALALGLAMAFGLGSAAWPALDLTAQAPDLIAPVLHWKVIAGLAAPLYLVTMAGQNLPGFAILRTAGYTPPVRPALVGTGALSALTGMFGAPTVSVAAITAAICLTEDTHPDPAQRWKVGLAYGLIWCLLGAASPLILSLLAALPADLMTALVAMALLGPLTGALAGAFQPAESRFAASLTLCVTASGIVTFGIGGAFWGLMAGLAVWGLERAVRR